MKVNLKQLYNIGDNWRDRTIRLVQYYKNPNNPTVKRTKAFLLSIEMSRRVIAVSQEIFQRTQPRKITFNKGSL